MKVDDPAGDAVLREFPNSPANPQPIHPGSYVHVEKRLRDPLGAFTLEALGLALDPLRRELKPLPMILATSRHQPLEART